MSNLINWSEVSRLLTSDRTAIRSDYKGLKYIKAVKMVKQHELMLKKYLDDFDENLSECCGAKIYEDTDICSNCKEHC